MNMLMYIIDMVMYNLYIVINYICMFVEGILSNIDCCRCMSLCMIGSMFGLGMCHYIGSIVSIMMILQHY